MACLAGSGFRHRRGEGGLYYSICVRCFLTVAFDKDEPELACPEYGHTCDPFRLLQFARDACPATTREKMAIPVE